MHRRLSRPTPACLLAGLVIVLSGTGCALTGTNKLHYTADTLPDSLVAPIFDNPRTVQWTKLAMHAVGSQSIAAGDVLEVTIASGLTTNETLNWPVRVNLGTGLANMPGIGLLPLAGLTLEGAEAAITAACINKGLFLSPNVTVMMKQPFKNRIMVLGGVKEPGVYELSRERSSLLAAIYAAGGLASDAGTNIEIKHGPDGGRTTAPVRVAGYSVPQTGQTGARTVRINLVRETESGSAAHYVSDGATVMIEKRNPEPIHVMGLVKKPNRYDFPAAHDVRVLDAIAMAGGVASAVADKIYVIRPVPESGGQTAVIQLSLQDAKGDARQNLRLQPRDTISVEHTPATIVLEAVKIIRFGLGASLTPFL
ncbi:MAG: SLBB domain-containing protein [Planctomycetaceae bacterium]